MADPLKSPRQGALAEPAYDIGFGKPPVATRFQKGASGNPRGRPKAAKGGSRNSREEPMKAIFAEEAYRTISVRDGERTIKLPVIQAVLRSIALNAAKGNQRAQLQFVAVLERIETEKKARYEEYLQTMIEYKSGWEQELDRRKKLGLELPELFPHPDDIRVDFAKNTVRIVGPMCRDDKPVWDSLRAQKKDCEDEIRALIDKFKTKLSEKQRAAVRADLMRQLDLMEKFRLVLPD